MSFDLNEVYYRLLVDRNDNLRVVTMQSFDEYDYDQSRFANEERYITEEQAEEAMLALKIKIDVPLTTMEKIRVLAMLEEEGL